MSGCITNSLLKSHQLREYLPAASYVGCGNITFREMTTHSARCGPGSLFVALSGSEHRQGQFLREAAKAKACGVLTDFPLPDIGVPQCVVRDVRQTYGELCQALAGKPAEQLSIIGVTGTNGKTTITWLLRSIFRAAQKTCGLLGTIEYDDGVNPVEPARLTTPDAETLADWMSRMVEQGTRQLVMEVSSHALAQRRIAGVTLQAAIITNITRDHLDYHGDFQSYQRVKAEILNACAQQAPVVVNGDDPAVLQALEWTQSRQTVDVQTVGFQAHNQVRLEILEETLQGSRFRILFPNETLTLQIGLPGRHNVMNAAQAVCVARACGCSQLAIVSALQTFAPPPGRMQQVEAGQDFTCLIDYAHTSDAIEQVLSSLRPLVPGRLICLFGAGGNRDRAKRPEMSQAACLAEVVVLTTDNSREESQQAIFDDLLSGFPAGRTPDCVQADRAAAIDWAVAQARSGDCLLILGKGHETTQEIAGESFAFDDAQQARESIDKYHPCGFHNPLKLTA